MLILLEYYVKYKKQGIKPTPEILKMNEDIKKENNRYIEFIKDKLSQSNDIEDRLKQSLVNERFAAWMKSKYPLEKFKKTYLTKYINKEFQDADRYKFSDGNSTVGWINILYNYNI